MGWLALSLWDAVPLPAKGAFLKKRTLEPSKTFSVREGEAGQSGVFRAGTSSRLKRLGLFRSCRREASSKTQGLSEDASHHARKHKTPQRGRRPASIDRFPKNNGSGIPDSMPFHEKYVARPQKKFSDRPLFQKGSPGCRAGALRKVSKKGSPGAGRGAMQREPGCRAGCPAKSAGRRAEIPKKRIRRETLQKMPK